MASSMLIDTHCHLNHPRFADDLEPALERAHSAGISAMIVIGYDLASSERAVELARTYPLLWATVGIHPHDALQATPEALRRLEELARDPRVVAIGEIGLDYYRDLSPRDAQRRALREQIALALALDLPVVIHTRDSIEEALETLLEHREDGLRGVLHCWSGELYEARRAMEAGWRLGIGGVVTYRNAATLQAVVREAPVRSLLLETDAPYLPPQPRRGQRNEPAFLPWVAERVAALRNASIEEVARATTESALGLFQRMALL